MSSGRIAEKFWGKTMLKISWFYTGCLSPLVTFREDAKLDKLFISHTKNVDQIQCLSFPLTELLVFFNPSFFLLLHQG